MLFPPSSRDVLLTHCGDCFKQQLLPLLLIRYLALHLRKAIAELFVHCI